ncbi:hypothetical protein B1218_34720 [Pseudomonas ogarae]|nr:hypothetical protein B1218_34720 [Pseudomonas ogarae]
MLVHAVRAGEREKVEALESGADVCVTKPFGGHAVIAGVDAILRRAPAGGRQEAAQKLEPRTRMLQRVLSQPLFVPAVLPGDSGKYVSHKDTLAGFKGMLNGDYNQLPDPAFYMVGGIEEASEKAKKL